MTFLKKFGQIALTVGGALMGFAPMITQTASAAGASPTIIDRLSRIFGIITDVETMGQSLGLPGTDKARAAGPLVAQVVLDLLKEKGITVSADQNAAILKASTALGGAVADILNAAHPDSVKTTSIAA